MKNSEIKEKQNKTEKKRISSLFNNRTFAFGFALVVALVCWAAVAFSSSTEVEIILRDVPVTINGGSVYSSYGLEVMNSNVQTVDVTVRGPRAIVGRLNASSVIVRPLYNNVTAAGTYELNLTSEMANPMDNFVIVSVAPYKISLRFDTPASKRFAIDTSGIVATAAEGYMIDKITTDPVEVSIVGSQEDIARINKVAVKYRFDRELSQNERLIAMDIYVYDEFGNEISKDNLKMSSTTADVTIPVYKVGAIELDIGFTNVPDGFDIATLNYTLSVKELEIAGMESMLANMNRPWIIGYVDLATFEIGKEYTFNVELPSGVVNRGSNSVTVVFARENIATKRINVTDIRLENVPSNYDVTLITRRIDSVTAIGRAADIEALLPGSVIAVVDFSKITIERGRYAVPVTFKVTSNNTTWIAGSYTVIIEVDTR